MMRLMTQFLHKFLVFRFFLICSVFVKTNEVVILQLFYSWLSIPAVTNPMINAIIRKPTTMKQILFA
jgi:hypothetical protein